MSDTPSIPNPTHQQQQRADILNGLPYIALSLHPESVQRVVGKLLDGSEIRAGELERVWNEALIIDFMEGRAGAWLDMKAATCPRDIEIMLHAEKLFGVDILLALPTYLRMERTNYALWEHRPRALWPRAHSRLVN